MRDRREFLRLFAAATGAVVVLPVATNCRPSGREADREGLNPAGPGVRLSEGAMLALPLSRPEAWDPVAFNKIRGNQGAIPGSYLPKINGVDGVQKHLGKHLPYRPQIDASLIPGGYIALMWGDPYRGYAQHPQSPKASENYPRGHWYDWIRIRRAVEENCEEVESSYSNWPKPLEGDSGLFVASDAGSLLSNGGRNTAYLAKLPADIVSGDSLRIYGHCLYHGEYVDFVDV